MTSCLIIDDDRLLQAFVSEVLGRLGYEVRTADTCQGGLESFLEDPADLVLLDVVLPDGSGLDLLPRLLEADRTCQVVVISGYFSLESALDALRAGAGDFLPKPLSEEMLAMCVERLQKQLVLHREKQALYRRLEGRVDELSLVIHFTQLITSQEPDEVWMREVIDLACSYLKAQAGSLLVRDPKSDELVFYTASGPKESAISKARLARGKGIAWWCLENQQTAKIDDAYTDPRFDPGTDARSGFVTRNLIVAPLLVQGKAIGVVELLNSERPEGFQDEDLEKLVELSCCISVAIHNVLVARDLKCSREKLSRWSEHLEKEVEARTRDLREALESRELAFEELDRAHDRLKQMQRTLVEQEKMAAVGLLGAGVSHEINNPLGFVNSNLATLEAYARSFARLANLVINAHRVVEQGDADRQRRLLGDLGRIVEEEHLETIVGELDSLFDDMGSGLARITGIVEQLRIFSEEGSAEEFQASDLNAELARLVELVQATLGMTDIRFDLREIPPISAPIKSLRQTLLTLLRHAGKHPDASGSVLLRTSRTIGHAVFDMIDPHQQLDSRDLEKLFDPFYLPSDTTRYGGLGLSSAYGLARNMGGALRAFRPASGGTCIQLTLPVKGDGGDDPAASH